MGRSPGRGTSRHPAAGAAAGASAGFTLLEVLIAVAILGTTLVAVLQLHASTVDLVARADRMATAARLAKNRMVDALRDGLPAPGEEEGDFEPPDPPYHWVQRVQETPYSTEQAKVYEISVEVSWGDRPDQRFRVRTFRVK
ncbi:MAG: type II secretion system protein [Nitrospirae bacterium]|nr:MAG: type II secretion system protein [Nitrospirota bacterium]